MLKVAPARFTSASDNGVHIVNSGALQRGRLCPTGRRREVRTFPYVELDVSGATLLVA